ncbi:MAG TPA: secondary thiamine-phosphate synthase enzyme YjbQ [Anaerolineaceae bacterium]|nr:secondary thiamine-phosphate synthase enzyme YjbQ [Anaerolineaceae bacterium]
MIAAIQLQITTTGNGDVVDITHRVAEAVLSTGMQDGIVTVFSPSATSGLTTIEYEPGAVRDFQRLFDEIVPPARDYAHNERWGDGNGHSHVRAALVGPSITIPFVNRKLTLGTWQQIILVDFDTRPRQRRLHLQLLGE